jgi:hypothetical protein
MQQVVTRHARQLPRSARVSLSDPMSPGERTASRTFCSLAAADRAGGLAPSAVSNPRFKVLLPVHKQKSEFSLIGYAEARFLLFRGFVTLL